MKKLVLTEGSKWDILKHEFCDLKKITITDLKFDK